MNNLQTLKTADFEPIQAKAIENQHGAKQQNKKAIGLWMGRTQ